MLQFRSTADEVSVTALQAGAGQLAASGPPPAAAADHDLLVRFHQSLVNNATATVMSGMTLTDERLVQLIKRRGGEVPEELQPGPDKDPWSIGFDYTEPVSVTFGDAVIRVAIRGRRFTRGDQPLNELLEISANYAIELGERGAKLVRQGDVNVEFPRSQGRLSTRQIAYKTFMRRKFGALFKEEYVAEEAKLPERLAKAGPLRVGQISADDGWLTVAWDRLSQEAPATAAR
jgi:hypothetical protein